MATENIEETLTRIALKIAKQKKGCILVIMNNKFDYAPLIEQDVKPFSVFDNQRRTEALAIIDGACIISPEGELINYASNIMNTKTYSGYGTRHAAAYTASHNGNIVIMASEEDGKVRIFKDAKLIMQLDSTEKGIEQKTGEIANFLESFGAGTLASIGVGVLVPTVGITLIPGIIIFTSAHYAFRLIGDMMNKNKKV